MSDIITYNINIEKYALLKKINPDYINVIIGDILKMVIMHMYVH